MNVICIGLDENCLDNASVIQNAIDKVSESGGGKVILKEGSYRCGTILLKDNVELHLEKGCRLIAGDDFSLFSLDGKQAKTGLEVPSFQNCDYDGKPKMYFLCGFHLHDVKITGEGTIDGNEELFYGYQDRYFIDGCFYPRMPLIYFEDVDNLALSNVCLTRSAFWTVHLVGCRYVFIDSIKIRNNLKLANCDGIDPDHCQNVEIKNCDIECADDGIVFKNTKANCYYGDLEKVHVRHCHIKSTSGAIKFGSESFGRFHDIHVEDVAIVSSNRGISFQLRDDGEIDHCLFENIQISTRAFAKPYYWGYGEPIYITALKRNQDVKHQMISDIVFQNIMIDTENGIFVYGEDELAIQNVQFRNLSLFLHKKSKWEIDKKDLRPYDACPFLEEKKPNVLYLKGCSHLEFSNFLYDVEESYQSNVDGIYQENCNDVLMNE